jgi:cytochrome c oxidase subunit III
MSDHSPANDHAQGNVDTHGHDDPMSHVPPGSIWPLLLTIALMLVPIGTLIFLPNTDPAHVGQGKLTFSLQNIMPSSAGEWAIPQWIGIFLLSAAGLWFLFTLMGWAHQIIKEKVISHDLTQQQGDLKQFIALFLIGEFAVFGAMFAWFYHRKIWDPTFGPAEGMHFGGAMPAYATFILISSSATCEIAHRAVEHGQRGFAKFMLLFTIVLGVVFLGFQGFEYGELIARGFSPGQLGDVPAASFASIFFTSTGFHGLHVAIGLVMLFMVLLRLEVGHFKGTRHFSMIAASWYWHFVDIVWILLFITIYVVA